RVTVRYFLSWYGDHRDLHSFPTRRSSDLEGRGRGRARRRGAALRRADERGARNARSSAERSARDRRAGTTPLPLAISARPLSRRDRKSTRLNSSHVKISYAVFCLKKKKNT